MVGNINFSLLETVLQVLTYGSTGNDIEETSFDVASYQTYRIGLQVIAHLIFLWSYVQYIHIDHRDGNVLITDSAYKLFGYDSFFLQVAAYYIADGAE